jgi:hypothetical protein
MFACPATSLTVVSRLAPLALDVSALVFALNAGLNFSALQLSSCNGVDRATVEVSLEPGTKPTNVELVASGVQLVGL